MKILVLNGSCRKKGNSARVLQLIQESLEKLGARYDLPVEVETIYLGHMDVQMCRGCRVCFDKGQEKCPLRDDLPAIKDKILAADGIIMASPVYVGDVSGVMKNFIDRLAHVCHRPEFCGKSVYFVATTGSSPTRHTIRSMQGAWISWGAYLVGGAGFKTGALMKNGELRARHAKKARNAARQLFEAVRLKKYARPPFISLMLFRTQQSSYRRAAKETLDYKYWAQKGWTNPSREYFIQHSTNRLTVGLARLAGIVFTWLVT